MTIKQNLHLEHTYLSLPNKFYELVKPASTLKLEPFLWNEDLATALHFPLTNPMEFVNFLLGLEQNEVPTFAQAYAGHQFGYFTKLGDGRAIVVGEYVTPEGNRYDIQLKGSGITPYSRNGDGKASLGPMLREYLISEAMFHLNIPTSRSLAVFRTGEPVFRETIQEGSILVRVMASHIRVGTFEFARYYGNTEDLYALLAYTVQRLYPEIQQKDHWALSLLQTVMHQQMQSVLEWMRVGFIHGVMNTDNVSISGETFDYGPCAFMNTYHPATVYSSIDTEGRYAWGNQPAIMKWNLSKLAEALLPLIHPDPETAVSLAQELLNTWDSLWHQKFMTMMLNKIGIPSYKPEYQHLVVELLQHMQKLRLDYTNTFLALTGIIAGDDDPFRFPEMQKWHQEWRTVLEHTVGFAAAQNLMKKNNPVYIPRNHWVERAIEEAKNGDLQFFYDFLRILKNPYDYHNPDTRFISKPPPYFDAHYRTFCGT